MDEKRSPGRDLKRLGSYVIESLLARGGMGEVYLAWDERLKRRVAVKRVRADAFSDVRRRARLRREALAVARLSHPAVVQVYDILETEEGDCIVMEYVEGSSLRELSKDRPLELALVLRLAGEIADGLAEAHSKGLVHRDLKAENVVVTPAGHAKILDFGLATWMWNEDDEAGTITEAGALVGTAHAMSPEQASGKRVDHRSDLFAFGVLLYEMLTRRSPFRGTDLLDTLRRITTEPPRPVRELRSDVPPPLAELVERLLEKDPGRRPPSVRWVAMELARLAGTLPASAPPFGPPEETGAEDGSEEPAATDSDELPTVSGVRTPSGRAPSDRAPSDRAPSGHGWRPAVGRTIPRRENWRLEERIGEGGFGEVWLARHLATGEPRVFKFCFDEKRRRALEREVTLFRLLKEGLGGRDDIARVLDWRFDSEVSFLESEYTEGGDLPAWAERQGGLAEVPLETRLELVAEVAEALAAAHSVGILHKDVKPANVLIVSGRGGRPHVRLSDFGIGLLTDPERLEAAGITAMGFTGTMTESGSDTGTLRYLAPELIEGKPPTIQSDVYSLGVMLYQVVVGDFSRVLAPGWHREIADELLCDDVALCVDGVPERRPASAAEVAERLRGLDERRRRLADERRARLEEERMARDLERARQRRRWLAGIAAATAAMLMVVALFALRAERERRFAEEARREAERRHAQAEGLIGFMLGDLRRELEPIGRLAVLDKVGEKALEYFAAVPEEDLSDEELRHRARAYYQIGSVQQDLGNFPAAGEAFQTALRLARERSPQGPDDDEWQFELGQSLFWVGQYFFRERDLDRAQEYLRAYLEVAERLVVRDPHRDDWQLELAYAHSNLASVLDARGEWAAALAEIEPSVAVLEDLVERRPENAAWQLELSEFLSKIGSLRRAAGDLAGAVASFEATLEIRRSLVTRDPDNAEFERRLAIVHNHLGDLFEELGQPERALEHYRADLKWAETLVARDPENAVARRGLAISHQEVGRLYQTLGELTLAEGQLELAGKLSRELLELDPEYTAWRLDLADAHRALGALRLTQGHPGSALEKTGEALAVLESIDRSSPEDIRARRISCQTLWLLGQVRQTMGEASEARRAWEEAVEIVESVARESHDAERLETWILETWVLPLLALDRLDEARLIAEELHDRGFREPRFLELCRIKGVCPRTE